jgi:phage tail sheath gpL-like
MSISFNQIPVALRVPGVYVEIDGSQAVRGLSIWPAKILVVGQRLTAGTQAALAPVRVTSDDQARTFFGAGSMLAHMLLALRRANRVTETWAIALDDLVAGVAATGTITFGGAPTAAGTLELLIAGRRVRVGVASGATLAAIATATAAAVNADASLPVTAAADAAVVTLTARHKGECGNAIDVRHSYYAGERLPAGLTVAIVGMADGAGNPDIEDALDAFGDTWFTDLVTPYTDAANLTAAETKADAVFGPLVQRDLHVWAGASASVSGLGTLGDSRNSKHLSIVGLTASPTPPWELAATLAGAAIGALAIDPARPVQTLALPGVLAPAVADRHTFEERNLLLFDGISTVRFDDGGNATIERVITTYKTNALGAADPAFLDVETLKTLGYLRFDLRTLMSLRFPRHKLADDGTQFSRGQAVATPKSIRGEIVARFRQWEEAGLVEGAEQFKEQLLVVRSQTDPNRVDALLPPDIVNQLRVLAAQIQFRL